MKKSLLKNIFCFGLSAMLMLSAAACTTTSENNSTTSTETTKSTESSSTSQTTSTATQPAETEIVNLKMFTMGVEPQAGMDELYKQLDALTIPDLGATVRFDFVAWGDEKNKINLNIISGDYDIYIGGGFSGYKETATKNAFKDLNPLLQYVPELVAHYSVLSDKTLSTHEVNGGLYGIPQFGKPEKGGGQGEGMVYREDLRKKWGLPEINSIETMDQYLTYAQTQPEFANQAQIIDSRFWTAIWDSMTADKYGRYAFSGAEHYAVFELNDPFTVISIFDTPEYKKVLEYAKKWYDAGIVDHDILAVPENNTVKAAELMSSGQKAAELNSPMWSIENSIVTPVHQQHSDWELGWYDYAYGKAPLYLPSVSNSTAISISSRISDERAIVALKFLEKAHTDRTYYDLLMYGVLGVHYEMVNGAPNSANIPPENKKPSLTGLADGYMNYYIPSNSPSWESIKTTMRDDGTFATEYSPHDGFNFDVSALSVETSNIEQVRVQYLQPLRCGVTNDIDKDLAIAIEMFGKDLETYLSALQEQLNTFKANK